MQANPVRATAVFKPTSYAATTAGMMVCSTSTADYYAADGQ